jgi:hypothetical protein
MSMINKINQKLYMLINIKKNINTNELFNRKLREKYIFNLIQWETLQTFFYYMVIIFFIRRVII